MESITGKGLKMHKCPECGEVCFCDGEEVDTEDYICNTHVCDIEDDEPEEDEILEKVK